MRNLVFVVFAILLFGCKKKQSVERYTANDATYLHRCEQKLRDIIVVDIFTPPVASRVYVYPLIAAYEAAHFAAPNAKPILSQLKDFEKISNLEPNKEYDFTLAAVVAFCKTADKVVFAKKDMAQFADETIKELSQRNENEVNMRSIVFGEAVANVVIKHLNNDNYKETRGMERFEAKAKKGLWVPTLPDYADAVEPHWNKLKTLVMDSAAQFRPTRPALYSENQKSLFWQELTQVYEAVKNITPEQDEITTFWDDNPFVSRHKGHLMFQDKKMTPGGHWLAIYRQIATEKKLDFVQTARGYALTSVVLYEAFISCWDEKYRSIRVRPETIIKEKIEKDWKPWLVTPPFPAYTSGHSTVSAAAAEALTICFGDNIEYLDNTEKEYGLPVRRFKSFREAALEASMSRVYAGIHYKSDCDEGNKQGQKVGQFVLSKLIL